jgi:periplasmic protein CpxP/Spy
MNDTHQSNNAYAKRRGFFRRAGIFAAMAGLAGGIGLHAQAQGDHGSRGGIFGGPLDAAQMDERMERMLKHLYVEINATEEQKKKLDPIVKQAIKDLLPFREQMRSARAQAIGLLGGERIDRAALETLRAERLKNAEAASKRLTQALADVAEVLTPAQRKALSERAGRHRGMWHRG